MTGLEDKIRAVLAHGREVGDLVEIYLEQEDADCFQVGFIENVGSETASIVSLTKYGEFDGRLIIRLDEVIRLHVGGDYLESLKVLHESRGKVFDPEPADAFGKDFIDFNTSLGFAREKRIMVTIHDFDKETTLGFVSDLGEDWVQIEPILRDGRSDGFTIFRIEDITRVDMGGKTEQARGFVHQARLGR